MPDDFDPYYTWLGIPPAEQPADHYRLLGVPRLEANPDVISNAADARMAFLRTFQSGAKGHYTQRILNELAVARTTLLNEPRKAAYDQQLRQKGAHEKAAHEQGMSVIPVAEPQPDTHQQQAMLELQRQLESVRAREQSLAQQQAQYAAALAQAEAMRQAQAQQAAAMRQREAQVAATAVAVRPAPTAVQSDPFAGLTARPALTLGRPQKKKSPWDTIPLPLVIAGLAVPALLVLLLVGYLATRGGGTTPTANIPSQPPAVPPKIVTPPKTKGNNSNTTNNKNNVKPSVTPASRDSSQTVDLLARIEAPRDIRIPAGGGDTTKENGVLKLRNPINLTCAVVPGELPSDYQIEIKLKSPRCAGLSIGLHIGGRSCMVSVDGWGDGNGKGALTALETIDGKRPPDEGFSGKPYFGQLIKPGVEARLTLRVVGNTLKISCDDKEVFAWSGDPNTLGNPYFDQQLGRSFFIGCWASDVDVTSILLQSLDKTPSQPGSTSPAPAQANQNDSPWRWARYRGDITSVVLSPAKDKALFFASRKTGENMLLVDMATGDLVKRANAPDEGVEESSGQALGPGPRYTVAYLTPAAGKTKLQHLVTMPQPDGKIGMSVMVNDKARMAFSSKHPLWAHSDGAGDAGVVIRSTNDESEIDRIRPPQGLNQPFVERIVDDGKYLLIEYTGQKKAGTQTFDVHRIVTFDWESRQPRQTCDLSREEASGMRGYADAGGLKLQNDGLLVWGRGKDVGATGWFKFPSGDGFWSSADNSSPTLTVVDVLTGPRQLYLMLDTATNTLLVRSWDFRNKDISKLQYASTIEEARFVDGGRGVLVLPRSSEEPILCWDVEQLNKAQTIAAPKVGDVGLAITPGLNRAAKAQATIRQYP